MRKNVMLLLGAILFSMPMVLFGDDPAPDSPWKTRELEKISAALRAQYPFRVPHPGMDGGYTLVDGGVVTGTLFEINDREVTIRTKDGMKITHVRDVIHPDSRVWLFKDEYNAEIERQARTMLAADNDEENFRNISGAFGFVMGEPVPKGVAVESSYDKREVSAQVNSRLFGQVKCTIGLNRNGDVCRIWVYSHGIDANRMAEAVNFFTEAVGSENITVDDSSSIYSETFIYKKGERWIHFSVDPPSHPGGHGEISISFTAPDVENILEDMTKKGGAISSKYDPMDKVTWYKTARDTALKGYRTTYIVRMYIGVWDSGKILLRLYTLYSGSRWIFYDRVQFLGDDGAEWLVDIKSAHDTLVGDGGTVYESADVLLKDADIERLRALLRNDTIQVRFRGKDRCDFKLSIEQLVAMREILEKYDSLVAEE